MTKTRATLRRLRWTALVALGALGAAAGSASGATSTDLLACQKALDGQLRGYSNVVYQRLFGCAERVVECKLAQEIDTVDPTACVERAALACDSAPAKLADQATSRKAKVLAKCGLITLTLADLEQYDQGLGFFNVAATCSAMSVSNLVDCVFANAQCAAEKEFFRLDPRAQDSLTTAGVAASFPCVAP